MGFILSYEFSVVEDFHFCLLDKIVRVASGATTARNCPHLFTAFTVSHLASLRVYWKDEEFLSLQYLFSLSPSSGETRLFSSAHLCAQTG